MAAVNTLCDSTFKMPSDELEHLLRVLEERDIALGRDDVAWAFESSKTEDDTRAWVREHLSEPSLLTKEELTLYAHDRDICSSDTCLLIVRAAVRNVAGLQSKMPPPPLPDAL